MYFKGGMCLDLRISCRISEDRRPLKWRSGRHQGECISVYPSLEAAVISVDPAGGRIAVG